MMKSLVLLFALAAMLTGIDCGPFYCTRSSQPCPVGVNCLTSNGTCQCPPGLQGDDCSIKTDAITNTDCTCKNGGVCVKEDNNTVCACSVYYYGPDCSIKRYHVKCYRDEILFNINPVGSFPGYAVVKDQPDPQCRSHPVPKQPVDGDNIPDTWSGHVLRLKYDSPVCGNTTLVEKGRDTSTYTATVIVHFEANEVKDEFVGVCEVKYDSVVKVTVNVGGGSKTSTTSTTTTTRTYPSASARSALVSTLCCILTALTTWLIHSV